MSPGRIFGCFSSRKFFQIQGAQEDCSGTKCQVVYENSSGPDKPREDLQTRVFNSFIMKKMLTGLIEPIFFLSKNLSYTIVLFGNICYNGSQEGLT